MEHVENGTPPMRFSRSFRRQVHSKANAVHATDRKGAERMSTYLTGGRRIAGNEREHLRTWQTRAGHSGRELEAVDHDRRVKGGLSGAAVMHPAVARLGEGADLLARIVADRPALVAAALLDGTTMTQVAAALGWEVAELRMAIGRWAGKLRKAGRLTEAEYTALLAVVSQPVG
jgi:hypothetical protein